MRESLAMMFIYSNFDDFFLIFEVNSEKTFLRLILKFVLEISVDDLNS